MKLNFSIKNKKKVNDILCVLSSYNSSCFLFIAKYDTQLTKFLKPICILGHGVY